MQLLQQNQEVNFVIKYSSKSAQHMFVWTYIRYNCIIKNIVFKMCHYAKNVTGDYTIVTVG
jgi:hypothetical protein